MQITVVIPTRNRPNNIDTVVTSVVAQTTPASGIIIVDASDNADYLDDIRRKFANINLQCIVSSERSVCVQRNLGIKVATSDWIFMCDDDIELPPNHFETLSNYANAHPECGAVSGVCLQAENGVWVAQYPVKNFFDLLWRYVFQLSVWSDLKEVKPPLLLSSLHHRITNFYRRKGNTFSNGGWPLITDWREPSITSATYALGASLIKRTWLIHSPYDEVLDASGIGDNYGVALNFEQTLPIHILIQTPYYHHRAAENRITQAEVYYRRALALNYFTIRKNENVKRATAWLVWSLFGNGMRFLLSGKMSMAKSAMKASGKIIFGKNPYWHGHLQGKRIVTPE